VIPCTIVYFQRLSQLLFFSTISFSLMKDHAFQHQDQGHSIHSEIFYLMNFQQNLMKPLLLLILILQSLFELHLLLQLLPHPFLFLTVFSLIFSLLFLFSILSFICGFLKMLLLSFSQDLQDNQIFLCLHHLPQFLLAEPFFSLPWQYF
jgi:hypothetical protein